MCGIPRLHDFADPLPSPASAVASLTRDLESDLHQLELRDWAVQGQYVVKPQVNLKNTRDFRGITYLILFTWELIFTYNSIYLYRTKSELEERQAT